MPCDDSTTCAIEIVNTSITVANATSCNESEGIICRKKQRHSPSLNVMNNRYSVTRPMDLARNLSVACSPSSSSTSSSSFSASTSSSGYDNPRQTDSTNSSSSLILILERPEDREDSRKNEKIIQRDVETSPRSEKSDRDTDYFVDGESLRRLRPSDGFSEKVTTSSIENLARKKGVTPTARCRRKRSTTSPRNHHNRSMVSENETPRLNSASFKTRSVDGDERTDFVATSTLMKNGDCAALSISNNSLRSAAKLGLITSLRGDSTISRHHDDNVNRDIDLSARDIETVASHATLTPQQSMISVAAIRGTNMAVESRNNNNNNNESTGVESIGTPRTRYIAPFAPGGAHLNNNNNNNIKNNNDNHETDKVCENRGYPSRSTSSRSSTILPLAVISSHTSSSASSSQQSPSAVSKKGTQMLTTSGTKYPASTVRTSPTYVLSSTRELSTGISSAADFENSLKSSLNATVSRAMRTNRPSRVIMSLHASLGRLPTTPTAYSALATAGGDATSLENLEISSKQCKTNEETHFAPITLYSDDRASDGRKNSSSQARGSLESRCPANGGSTSPSSLTKTPMRIIASPAIGNSPNYVANAFRNNHVASGCNSNHNQRCNHLAGACTCSATATTSQTSSTLTRSSNIASGVATSSWPNTSVEQETDYVVDPVQGNAYHKGQFLGKGGFARVYLMTDVANGNQYACKIIPKNRMQKIHIQKIAREIMIHKELNHINVVQMHHYFEDNINVYMLLEPCPRKSLMHVLKYRGKVTEPEARYYMRQMVTGVAYIHSQKVVHRDLKPGNMFLSDGMIVKIGDFGLARRPDGQRRRVTICGTPNYIAPEVLYKQAYSYEADVWALGCILYALLAGQPPFDTSTLKETYARICNNRYKKLDDSIVSRSGQDLIRWLLQPIPELRPSLERVKEHPYLTMEYVPTKLSHTCCYKVPILHSIMPEQSSTIGQPTGTSVNSLTSRGIIPNENIVCNERNENGTALAMKHSHRTSNVPSIQANFEVNKILNLQKKPKVGNWLFRKLPKLPGFRQRLTKFLCPEHKKPDGLMMRRAIESCLAEIRYTRAQENPMLVDRIAPLFVTKWIDYSNKYGLGFQLSDRSVGVLFNDSTKMSYTHDRRRVEYATTEDEVTRYRRENDVPSCMEEKLELLRHFTHYMDNFLTNGGEVREQKATKFSRTNSNSVPRMKRWLRTDKAIVMELTVPLLQVNFFIDHSKIVVSEGTRERGYIVTYIDASRQASSYWLNDLRDIGCTADLYERLSYVSKVIGELENDGIFDNPTNLVQHRSKTLRT